MAREQRTAVGLAVSAVRPRAEPLQAPPLRPTPRRLATGKRNRNAAAHPAPVLRAAVGGLAAPPNSLSNWRGDPDHDMLGNDLIGDCTCADQGHWVNLVSYLSGGGQLARKADCLAMYQQISGWIPGRPATDQGAYIFDALQFMMRTGLGGIKVTGFAQLDWFDHQLVKHCIADFLGVHFGLQLPLSAHEQYWAGSPWTIVPGSPMDGGHDVLGVGYDDRYLWAYTWGRVVPIAWDFVDRYFDEAWISASPAMERTTVLRKYNAAQLNAEWGAITGEHVSIF